MVVLGHGNSDNEMYSIFCLIASGLVDFKFSSPNCMLTCILLQKMLLKTYYIFAVLSEVFSTGTEWDFICLFTCLPADGRNLSPHGAQTDGKMLVFSFQSSVLILLSFECISRTDYACQVICNMCHDSIFFNSTENPFCELTLPTFC